MSEALERLTEAVAAALAAGGVVMLGPERARLEGCLVAARAALGLTPGTAAAPDDDVVPSPELVDWMLSIRRRFPAVTYDAHDARRPELEAAARQAGLVLVPSSTIQPRSVRGCPLPAGWR